MENEVRPQLRFVALDGWRGVCAILVAMHNFGYPQIPFVAHSYLFVDFFFVLSGFVITHSYMGRLRDGAKFGNFILRRIGRLWPLHVVILSIFVGLDVLKLFLDHSFQSAFSVAPFEAPNSFGAIIQNLLLIQAIGIETQISWNGPSWSISTEFWTYVLFAVACLSTRGRPPSIWLMGAVAAGTAAIMFLFSPLLLATNTFCPLARCLYGFFVGHLVFRMWATYRRPLRSSRVWEIVAVAIVITYVSSCNDAASMAAPIVFGFAVWVFAHQDGGVSKVLVCRPLVCLGALSYSIYMVHWLVRAIVNGALKLASGHLTSGLTWEGAGHSWLMDFALVCYIAIVLVISSFTFKYIEQVCRRPFDRVAKLGSRKPIEGAATPRFPA